MKKQIKIVIIEDDLDFARLQQDAINETEKYSCHSIFSNPVDFLESDIENFDIILLDIVMPRLNGLDAITPILKKFPSISIVINSVKDDVAVILKALQEGAVGYIDKQNYLRYLEDVLDNVSGDGAFMTPKIARKIFDYFQNKKNNMKKLTDREKQIAQGIIDGLSYKLIASEYNISIDTVRMNIRNIYKKFKVNSKTEFINILNNFKIA